MSHESYGTINPDMATHASKNNSIFEPVRDTNSQEEEVATYPDGGRKAWLVLFGCFSAFFSGLSLMNSVGAYQAWLATHQLRNDSPSKIGWIFGFYNFFSFFASIQIGPLFDTYGPRILSICGAALLVTEYLVMGLCQAYWQFFLCISVLGGLATCLLFTCAIGTVQHWFLKRRGLATGLAISGGSIGGIVFPLILGRLLPEVGFTWTTRIAAFILLPFAICAAILMEGRFSRPVDEERRNLPNLNFLLRPHVAILAASLLCIEMGMFIPVSYITSYALDHQLPDTTSYHMLTFLNIGSLLGRWIPGYIGDRYGPFNTQIAALFLCITAVFGIWIPAGSNTIALVIFAVVFGFGSGSGIGLIPVCIAQMCKVEEFGSFYSTLYMTSSLGYA